jgi:hypothetical protein
MHNRRNRMKRWSVGGISSVCNVSAQLSPSETPPPMSGRDHHLTFLLIISQIHVLLFPVHQMFLLQRRK